MIIHTIVNGAYTALVYANRTVELFYENQLIDNPGPWGDDEGALQWAQLITARYAAEGHTA